ncbi:MAG: hypothetical protein R3B97_06795 [Dehalococcoidia bacterium]|nr:hypothetical protein [Dehalococcoidia bacterium]
MKPANRALVPRDHRRAAAAEAESLRAAALARVTEVDLLVAALQDHVRDLQVERDRLLSQVSQLRDEARRERSGWLQRGMKGNR